MQFCRRRDRIGTRMSTGLILDQVEVGERCVLEDCGCMVERTQQGTRMLIPLRRIARCQSHSDSQAYPAAFRVARHVRVLEADPIMGVAWE